MKNTKELRRRLFAHSKRWLYIAIVSVVVLSIYNIVISWLLQKIIDIAAGVDPTPLRHVLLISVISFAVFLAAYVVYRSARPRFIQSAMHSYKTYAFEMILRKRARFVEEGRGTDFLSAMTNDIQSVEDHYLDSILTIADIGISFVGALTLMLWYSPKLTVVALLFSILPIIVTIPGSKRLSEKERKVSDKNVGYVGIINEILSGFAVIKNYGIEKEIQVRFAQKNNAMEEAKFERRYAEENINLLSTAASVVMRLGVFIFGAWMAVTETGVTPGIVLVFLQLVSFVISPIEQLPAILANRSAALSIMNKLTEMIQTDAESSTGRTISGVCRRITFENVSFSYDDRKEVLHNICMDFEPGKKYVIVGCSGSGKSTILRLIMRAFENYTGRIMLDETEIREISFESLFRFTSFVQQDVFVFNDTIRNNITLYKEYPEERIAKAMNCAGLAAMAARCVEDSPCGEKGIALSGGERQRISIARAILRRTPVLLMDEATSALDKRTAHEVMEAVLRCKDTLCICVTHRLDDIILRQFDEILVLHDGRFVEHGCFGELIAKKGYFYSLYETTSK